MNTLRLAWTLLWARPVNAVLNLILLTLGLASVSFLLLVSDQAERAFARNLQGIDLVVGAKGSPMQLILAGVFHLDIPPGNVPLASVQRLAQQPLVAQVIPLSLGDSVHGRRVVGTTPDYVAHYGGRLAQGRLWQAPMEAVLGAAVARQLGLGLGAKFAGSHGLAEGGDAHDDQPYTVVGVLAPTGSVLDALVLTDLSSVWQVHEAHHTDAPKSPHADEAGHPADAGAARPGGAPHVAEHGEHAESDTAHDAREVTLALVRYRSPLAAVSLPRWVNAQTQMQAAAPAFEVTRLLNLLGVGTDVLRAFAAALLAAAGLSVFVALWTAVRERRGELALLRMLGAPPHRVAALLLTEALWLGTLAAVLGVAGGAGALHALVVLLQVDQSALLGGAWVWPPALLAVPTLAWAVALLAGCAPTWAAYRTPAWALLQTK